ncbi:GNAT family N-acetyltransferase [Piscibacillus salipiscarius]|uniref:GNAT family N-acetyltransferase n=1 Tax=Piscibacillus salipiscarius TaxID=299480 RepID=UPI0006D213A7|nr:GNAT family N-acetyltransferase [Piscibacillus salipiscarius]
MTKFYAWNGGTGILPEFRGTGLSHTLIEEVQAVYHEQGVNVANLEAITTNERAINLYEKHGYELIERLGFMQGLKRIKISRLFMITN